MKNIFERELAGEIISTKDPEYSGLINTIWESIKLATELNTSYHTPNEVREMLGKITDREIDQSVTLLPPFYVDYGKNISLGKNVFIQQCCTFFDRGGITIGNNVFIGPKVNIITLNHDINPENRSSTICKPVVIEDNVWIGITATILSGVTIGKNAIVSAGSVVTKNVEPNSIVGGNPARFIRMINEENN